MDSRRQGCRDGEGEARETRQRRKAVRGEPRQRHSLCLQRGFTIDYAEQVTVVSLPALRRLRFPATPGATSRPGDDVAARTYLAALGLLGATLAIEGGYDLRSRCLLRAPGVRCRRPGRATPRQGPAGGSGSR